MEDGAEESEGAQTPGILVQVLEHPLGKEVKVEMVGGFDDLAAPAALELAVNVARQKLGLKS